MIACLISGYGDIVCVTLQGKILTIIYALYGIPVFMWYIIKLGGLFRVLIMRFLRNLADCLRLSLAACLSKRDYLARGFQNLINTTARPVVRDVSWPMELKFCIIEIICFWMVIEMYFYKLSRQCFRPGYLYLLYHNFFWHLVSEFMWHKLPLSNC